MSSSSVQEGTSTDHDSKLKLRRLIENISEPLIMRNAFNWELLKWDIKEWQKLIGKEQLPFRRGKNVHTQKPQFENETDIVKFRFLDFIKYSRDPDYWYYFDYKYLKEWLLDVPELHKHVNWGTFGFPELSTEESTIWIGSKGAHTPCHIDTYGCNIVTQIYGTKRWLLFPPNEDLHPTRIPYEESSIYSSFNLYSPKVDDFKNVNHCRSVILNPGDALIVPHRWWHYVENLELAISINTWIQLPVDHEERLRESIVQMLVTGIVDGLGRNLRNPSNDSKPKDPPNMRNEVSQSLETILLSLKCYKSKQESNAKSNTDNFNVTELLKDFKNIEIVEEMSRENFIAFLKVQGDRFPDAENRNQTTENTETDEFKKILDALFHSDVIDLVKTKLLEQDSV